MKISSELLNLFEKAFEIAEKAYAPYSKFRVGAAILFSDGAVITGVNVENRSFGLTNCAERTAIYKAITEGRRDFKAIAIATPDAEYPVSPCGACRQVISEFMSGEVPIVFGASKETLVLTTVKEVYPFDALHELKNDP